MTHTQYIPPFLNLTKSDEDVLANVKYRNESIVTLFCAEMNKNNSRVCAVGEPGPYMTYIFKESIEEFMLDMDESIRKMVNAEILFFNKKMDVLKKERAQFLKDNNIKDGE